MQNQPANQEWQLYNQLLVTLKPQVDTSLQHYRGESWFVLRDHSTRKHLRVNGRAQQIIALLDGKLSLQGVARKLGGDEQLEQEIICLISSLIAADLLANNGTLAAQQQTFKALHDKLSHGKRGQAFNPLSIKVPLFNPHRLLERSLKFVAPLISRWFVYLAACVIAFAGLSAINHIEIIGAALNSELIAPANLVLMLAIYVAMKVVHELAHAFTLRRFGGEVVEIGVSFLVLMPVPYVDASDAWFIASKRQRIAVSLAGIFAELLLASLALFVWLSVGPGVVSDIAFNVMLIGSISTLLFNANPLLKFDGYYVLQDWLEIPNLASRSSMLWIRLLKRHFCGIHSEATEHHENNGFFWLLSYAPMALLYRLVLLTVIVQLLVAQYFFIGVMLACWAVFTQLLVPLKRLGSFLFFSEELACERRRVLSNSAAVCLCVLSLLFIIPAPLNSTTQGILWVNGHSEVYQGESGFLEEIYVQSGQAVSAGTMLMRLSNPELETEWSVKSAKLEELRAQLKRSTFQERIAYNKTRREIEALQYELSDLRQRVDRLQPRANKDGRFFFSNFETSTGMHFKRGELLGYVRDDDNLVVKAVIPQRSMPLLESGVEQIEFRLAQQPARIYNASVAYETLDSSPVLPSAALGAIGGGNIGVNQSSDGRTANENYFTVELLTSELLPSSYGLGGRAYVKFQHGHEPLGLQWWRHGMQLFSSRTKI